MSDERPDPSVEAENENTLPREGGLLARTIPILPGPRGIWPEAALENRRHGESDVPDTRPRPK